MLTSCLLTSNLYQFFSLVPDDFFSRYLLRKNLLQAFISLKGSTKSPFLGVIIDHIRRMQHRSYIPVTFIEVDVGF